MKILAFTGAGISKQSNIPTFMERPDVREKLFRSYANTHHEEYNEVIKQLKANMNGCLLYTSHRIINVVFFTIVFKIFFSLIMIELIMNYFFTT